MVPVEISLSTLCVAPASELDPCSKLHPAEVICSGKHAAETAIAGPNIRKREALAIRHIESLGLDLYLNVFANVELLGERHVEIADSVSPQIREVSRRISRDVVPGVGKAVLIQVRLLGSGRLLVAQAGPKLGTDHLRPLVAVS